LNKKTVLKITAVLKVAAGVISIGISIYALVVSINANTTAQKSLVLNEKIDERETKAIWLGRYDKDKNEMFVESNRSDLVLQTGKVYLPGWPVYSISYGYNSFPVSEIKKLLEPKLEEIIKKKESQMSINIPVAFGSFPIVIESSYIFKGEGMNIKSRYSVMYYVEYNSEPFSIKNINIYGMKFEEHLDMNKEIDGEDLKKQFEKDLEGLYVVYIANKDAFSQTRK
jgi:hypothetical protein